MKQPTPHTENGETHSLPGWAKITGLSISTVRYRISKGIKLTTPKGEREYTGLYPCGGCTRDCNSTGCTRWQAWFHIEWTNIQKAAENRRAK